MASLKARFNQFSKDFAGFDKVSPKLASRGDLHAMILLNQILPGTQDIIAGAAHDVVWLNIDIERLEVVVTDYQILELSRCGIHYDDDIEALAMFV